MKLYSKLVENQNIMNFDSFVERKKEQQKKRKKEHKNKRANFAD